MLAAEKKAVQRVDELEREVAELKKYKGESASLGACSIDELKRIDEALKQGTRQLSDSSRLVVASPSSSLLHREEEREGCAPGQGERSGRETGMYSVPGQAPRDCLPALQAHGLLL